jgi:hypothetical protein
MSQSVNPLKQFFRQPAIYLSLPSRGQFWPQGSIDLPQNLEVPVYPMTAIDEITYRTPDALFNGQAVVNVIQSCVPSIRDAWAIPATDLNAILIAIRIASYGHNMDISTVCPSCANEEDYAVDLRPMLNNIKFPDFNNHTTYGDLEISFHPMNYHNQNEVNQANFEQQKMIQSIQGSSLKEEEKVVALNDALKKITELTINALKWSIASIRTPNSLVTEPEFIHEFLTNCDRKMFIDIRDKIVELRQTSELPPLNIECTECSNKYTQVLNLDQASFFVGAS